MTPELRYYTGAWRNVLTLRCYAAIDDDVKPPLQFSAVESLQGIGSENIDVSGEVHLPVQFGTRTQSKAYLDFGSKKIVLFGEQEPYFNPHNKPKVHVVRVARTTVLDLGCEYIVPGYAHFREPVRGPTDLGCTSLVQHDIQTLPGPPVKQQPQRMAFEKQIEADKQIQQNFEATAKPLHELTKKNVRFWWTPECQDAFETLKNSLTTTPVLGYLRDSGDLILNTDASDFGIEAVVSQMQDGMERVPAYGSRQLSSTEQNYCTTRRELLAVVEFTRHFRQYLLERPFIVRSDHSSLRWLVKMKEPEGHLARWLEKLAECDFEVVH
ncbi:hypothetical protein NFI96_006899 [Prochilodus magdalenae]|nr:hypothetical protein NFI96_006899 [Prochilodus magdalenae]